MGLALLIGDPVHEAQFSHMILWLPLFQRRINWYCVVVTMGTLISKHDFPGCTMGVTIGLTHTVREEFIRRSNSALKGSDFYVSGFWGNEWELPIKKRRSKSVDTPLGAVTIPLPSEYIGMVILPDRIPDSGSISYRVIPAKGDHGTELSFVQERLPPAGLLQELTWRSEELLE